MDEVRVISSDKDGADLRREKRKSRYHVRCDGTADDREINDAIASLGSPSMFTSAEDYERIFGGDR
ncbi:hypothetical protein LCGC14_2475420 [marine sediment metagenome]|uniref:Uncharacterized protein n=1 Tax=marine sediment metagenome TaxID=412755 RepID=A0A0F9B9X5_9ZZZZ